MLPSLFGIYPPRIFEWMDFCSWVGTWIGESEKIFRGHVYNKEKRATITLKLHRFSNKTPTLLIPPQTSFALIGLISVARGIHHQKHWQTNIAHANINLPHSNKTNPAIPLVLLPPIELLYGDRIKLARGSSSMSRQGGVDWNWLEALCDNRNQIKLAKKTCWRSNLKRGNLQTPTIGFEAQWGRRWIWMRNMASRTGCRSRSIE